MPAVRRVPTHRDKKPEDRPSAPVMHSTGSADFRPLVFALAELSANFLTPSLSSRIHSNTNCTEAGRAYRRIPKIGPHSLTDLAFIFHRVSLRLRPQPATKSVVQSGDIRLVDGQRHVRVDVNARQYKFSCHLVWGSSHINESALVPCL